MTAVAIIGGIGYAVNRRPRGELVGCAVARGFAERDAGKPVCSRPFFPVSAEFPAGRSFHQGRLERVMASGIMNALPAHLHPRAVVEEP
jgi:hypothetical protein